MAKYTVIAKIPGAGFYKFENVTSRNGMSAARQIASKYYNTLCAVHYVGMAEFYAHDAAGAVVGATGARLNAFNSAAIFNGFTPKALPELQPLTAE